MKKSVKGRIITKYPVDHPIDVESKANYEFLSEQLALIVTMRAWEMYFDGATNRGGRGTGVVLITPNGVHLPLAMKLEFQQ